MIQHLGRSPVFNLTFHCICEALHSRQFTISCCYFCTDLYLLLCFELYITNNINTEDGNWGSLSVMHLNCQAVVKNFSSFFFFFPVLKDTSLYNAEVLPNLLLQLTLNYLLLLILEKHTNRKFIFISYNK